MLAGIAEAISSVNSTGSGSDLALTDELPLKAPGRYRSPYCVKVAFISLKY
jgi:hypothetical protein